LEFDFSTQVIADFAVIMMVAGIVTYIFHKIKQPLILGYLIAGIIIGPYLLPFNIIRQPGVESAFAEVGVLVLLFAIGLEFPLSKLMKIGLKTYAVISLIEIALMFGLSFLVGHFMKWSMMDSLFLSAALASSSTVVIAKVLTDMKKLKDVSATVMMGVLVVEDLAVVLTLSIITSVVGASSFTAIDLTWTVGKIILFIAGTLIIGLLTIPKIIDRINHPEEGECQVEHDEVLVLVALGFALGLSILADYIGLSMAIGAFLMGVLIANSKSAGRIVYLSHRIKELFGALFFVSIGAHIDVTLFQSFLVPAIVVIVVMLIGKVLGCGLGTKLMGYDLSTSLKVGFGMGQIGEFALIVAKVGQDMGVVSPFLFPTIGIAVAFTAFLTPYLIKASYRIDTSKWPALLQGRSSKA